MPKKNSYPKSEITKQSLIEAAKQLFISKGYHGTSMRDIADAAALSLGGIYNHFPDKEAIFQAIVLEVNPLPDLMLRFENEAPITNKFHEVLRFVIHQMVAVYETQPELLTLLMIELVEFDGQHIPVLFERFSPLISKLLESLARYETNLTIQDPFILFHSLVSMVWGYLLTHRLMAHLEQVPQRMSLDEYITIYLNGILKE